MSSSIFATLDPLRTALQREGLAGGLRFLNARVPHRYTAAYRVHQDTLVNLDLFDKAGEVRPEFLASVPFEDSFCQFVLRDGQFRTECTAQDARLDGHRYQGVMGAYHGVPLVDDHGGLFGTLCHFDTAERTLSDEEFAFLQKAARLMSAVVTRHAPR
ncbi:guanylate cyclase [Xenophilus aerolatus]|jgi:GAF domain-containing protein|nr:GAF domain-containing protein [Xenophilus aerolatus]